MAIILVIDTHVFICALTTEMFSLKHMQYFDKVYDSGGGEDDKHYSNISDFSKLLHCEMRTGKSMPNAGRFSKLCVQARL